MTMRAPIHRFHGGRREYLSYQLRDAAGRVCAARP